MKLLCFDTETTGVDVWNDRIVTAFLGLMDDNGSFTQQHHVLINAGVPIPEAASAVHGISTERMLTDGEDPERALDMLAWIINNECIGNGLPLVAFNAAFDITILTEELKRHGIHVHIPDWQRITIIDPFVLDKHLTPMRRGPRKLVNVAPIYGVPVETNAHDASADCLMTGRIALEQLKRHEIKRIFESGGLTAEQVRWRYDQQVSLQAYFRSPKGGKPNAVVNNAWPILDPSQQEVA